MAENFRPSSPKSSPNANDPFAKKSGALGQGGERKKRTKAASEYKKSLQEKQTLKRLYGLSEKQFKRYVTESLDKMQRVENVSDELIKSLEKRLDNVVFRLGFAKTRSQSRQLVNHAYFLINGKPVNIPSYHVVVGQVVSLSDKQINNVQIAKLLEEEQHLLSFLKKEGIAGMLVRIPKSEDVEVPFDTRQIIEYYSR